MMTVITNVTLTEGTEPEWDRIMSDRLAGAKEVDGWIGGEILMPLEGMNQRVIVGNWRSRADWEAWHLDPAFTDSTTRLDALQITSSGPQWHEVVAHATSNRALRTAKTITRKARTAATQLAGRVRSSRREMHSVPT
jgi:heme-degrading monooxygenase HmoA